MKISTESSIAELAKGLEMSSPVPVRMRAVYYLKERFGDAERSAESRSEIMDILLAAVAVKGDSVLIRHEVAFVIGQLRDSAAIESLARVLGDAEDDSIVRHECAEAIGAIGDWEKSIDIISSFCDDPAPEVAETCAIALERLLFVKSQGDNAAPDASFDTTDPAPAFNEELSASQLGDILCDTSKALFVRYRAMFSLRNMQTEASVLALNRALDDINPADDSDLFRHEVAYVLGQMEHGAAEGTLTRTLLNLSEHSMVRHEAAEALGAIGTDSSIAVLKDHLNDEDACVKDSCVVALDAIDYWKTFAEVEKKDE